MWEMEKTSALSRSPLHTEHSGKHCNFSLFAHKNEKHLLNGVILSIIYILLWILLIFLISFYFYTSKFHGFSKKYGARHHGPQFEPKGNPQNHTPPPPEFYFIID